MRCWRGEAGRAGGGVGAAVAIMSNLYDKKRLHGLRTSGYDFNLALGAKWAAVAKSAMKFPRIIRVVDKFNELSRAGRSGRGLIEGMKAVARQAASLSPDEYAALAKCARENKAALDAQDSDKPSVTTLSLPVPGAMEASLFYQDDKWYVEPSTGML